MQAKTDFSTHPSSGAFFKFKSNNGSGHTARRFESAEEFQDEQDQNPNIQWFDNPKLEAEDPVSTKSAVSGLEDEVALLKEQAGDLKAQLEIANKQIDTLSAALADSEKKPKGK